MCIAGYSIKFSFNKYHLKLNLLNTEVMMMGRSHQNLNITIADHTINQVQSFKYLGSTVNEQSTQEEEIKNRIAKYSQNVGCMYRLLKDRNVPKKAKQIIHQTILRPILIFGSECWTWTKKATTADYSKRNESYQNDTRGHQREQNEK